MAEIKFLEIIDDLAPNFTSNLEAIAGRKIAGQADRIIVPVQKIAGLPENFSVMSFPYPRMNSEALQDYPLIDEEQYIVNVGEAEFRIDVDHFGQINWIHIKRAPRIYDLLKAELSRVAEGGGYTDFWKF